MSEKKDRVAQPAPRTQIKDLPALGVELSAEELRQVAGGMMARTSFSGGMVTRAGTNGSCCSTCSGADCDADSCD